MIKASILSLMLISSTVFAGQYTVNYKGLVEINQEGRGVYSLQLKVIIPSLITPEIKTSLIENTAEDGLAPWTACMTVAKAPVLMEYEATLTNTRSGEKETVNVSIPLHNIKYSDVTPGCRVDSSELNMIAFYDINPKLEFKNSKITINTISNGNSSRDIFELVKSEKGYLVAIDLDRTLSPIWWFYAPERKTDSGVYTGYTEGKISLVRQ